MAVANAMMEGSSQSEAKLKIAQQISDNCATESK